MEMAENIPALLEHLDTVWLKVKMVGSVSSVFPVINSNTDTLLHSINDHLQIIALVRNLL